MQKDSDDGLVRPMSFDAVTDAIKTASEVNKAKPTHEVYHPEHYTSGDIECIDAIRSMLTFDQFQGYCRGCAMKYIWRADLKDDPSTNIQKAMVYLSWAKIELDKRLKVADA